MLKNKISDGIHGAMRSFSAINIALILLIANSTILGQTYEISGTIKDDAGKKVPNARITLYNKKLFLLRTERPTENLNLERFRLLIIHLTCMALVVMR